MFPDHDKMRNFVKVQANISCIKLQNISKYNFRGEIKIKN